MRLKNLCIVILVVFTGLNLLSCRDSDNEQVSSNLNENFKRENLKFSKVSSDSIQNESLSDEEDPPKDPPIKGTHWKIAR